MRRKHEAERHHYLSGALVPPQLQGGGPSTHFLLSVRPLKNSKPLVFWSTPDLCARPRFGLFLSKATHIVQRGGESTWYLNHHRRYCEVKRSPTTIHLSCGSMWNKKSFDSKQWLGIPPDPLIALHKRMLFGIFWFLRTFLGWFCL